MIEDNGPVLALGGGCHWCTEAVIASLRGTEEVEQGFAASAAPDDAFSEAVRLRLDEALLPLVALIEVHLRTHASTADHSMRGKYRSAVYVTSAGMGERAREALGELQAGFDRPLVTQVLPLRDFRLSEERFRRYREKRPDAPFCRTHIDPKLALLRERYGGYLAPGG